MTAFLWTVIAHALLHMAACARVERKGTHKPLSWPVLAPGALAGWLLLG